MTVSVALKNTNAERGLLREREKPQLDLAMDISLFSCLYQLTVERFAPRIGLAVEELKEHAKFNSYSTDTSYLKNIKEDVKRVFTAISKSDISNLMFFSPSIWEYFAFSLLVEKVVAYFYERMPVQEKENISKINRRRYDCLTDNFVCQFATLRRLCLCKKYRLKEKRLLLDFAYILGYFFKNCPDLMGKPSGAVSMVLEESREFLAREYEKMAFFMVESPSRFVKKEVRLKRREIIEEMIGREWTLLSRENLKMFRTIVNQGSWLFINDKIYKRSRELFISNRLLFREVKDEETGEVYYPKWRVIEEINDFLRTRNIEPKFSERTLRNYVKKKIIKPLTYEKVTGKKYFPPLGMTQWRSQPLLFSKRDILKTKETYINNFFHTKPSSYSPASILREVLGPYDREYGAYGSKEKDNLKRKIRRWKKSILESGHTEEETKQIIINRLRTSE